MKKILLQLLFILTAFAAPAQLALEGRSYVRKAETDTLLLEVNADSATFVVTDKRSGHRWTSFVPETEPSFQDANKLWQRNMQSLFTFSFTDQSDDQGTKQLSSLLAQDYSIRVRDLDGGTAFNVSMAKLGISLTVEVLLVDDRLIVRIPADSIVEENDTVLTTVSLLPFFGYADSSDEGYMLLPDGCGALYRYKPTGSRSMGDEKRVSWYVYSPEEVDFSVYRERSSDDLKNAQVPVFGVKLVDSAFAAIISEGDTDAYIHFAESGAAVNLNRVASEFTIRHAFELYLSEISVHGSFSESSVAPIRYDKDRIELEREITYAFLHGSQADYSGMAAAYRNHLKETGLLTRQLQKKPIPAALSLFGGVIEDRLLFDKYVAMTTFDEATEILGALKEKNVGQIAVNLIGWTKDGYFRNPIIWPPEKALGGRRDLRRFGRFTVENDIDLYLSIDATFAVKGNGRFNARTDVVKEGNQLSVSPEFFDAFLFNPTVALGRVEDLIKDLEGYGVHGLNFEAIGSSLYHDYNNRAPSSRADTMATWSEVISRSSEGLGGASLNGAHIDLALQSDLLFRVPIESSGYIVLDDEVPFYQMAIHGSVPYAGDRANLFHDTRAQYLRWIEFGCLPHYELTYRKSELLANTWYNDLFTSYFADWIDTVAQHYTEFNTEFGDFYHLEIIDHERIADNLVQTKYADGTTIYINYSDESVQVDERVVPAQDYLVVHKGVH